MSLFQKNWFLSVLIFVLAIAQYANTRNHDFAWDDVIVIVENSRVQKGWDDIPELFQNIKTSKTENRYGYRPISLLSFATDVEFFGVDAKASHRISILLYGILCVLVFLFFVFFVVPPFAHRNRALSVRVVAAAVPLFLTSAEVTNVDHAVSQVLYGLPFCLCERHYFYPSVWRRAALPARH